MNYDHDDAPSHASPNRSGVRLQQTPYDHATGRPPTLEEYREGTK